MCKKPLRSEQNMSAVEYVSQASEWANDLVRNEMRGPGDLDRAMRRVERKSGVPYAKLWALRYRKPKDILLSTFFALREAYVAERERQLRMLEHEIETTREIAGTGHHSVRAAEAVVDACDDAGTP